MGQQNVDRIAGREGHHRTPSCCQQQELVRTGQGYARSAGLLQARLSCHLGPGSRQEQRKLALSRLNGQKNCQKQRKYERRR